MHVLFDENMAFGLARDLAEHTCSHVIRLGWRGTKNGALLTRAESAGIDVPLTLDDDMLAEQNMQGPKFAVLVVRPERQGKAPLREMAGRVLDALDTIHPGEIRAVDFRDEY